MKIVSIRDVKLPERGTDSSAGIDFFVPNDYKELYLSPGDSVKRPSGIKRILETGKVGIFMNKSSHGSQGLQVGACVVDSDYRGEVHLNVHNIGNKDFKIYPGMKIVQMLVQSVDLCDISVISDDEFNAHLNTQRGSGGFGSTGDK